MTNTCGNSLNSGQSCQYAVQFGSIPNNASAGAKAGNLTVTYTAYPSAATTTVPGGNFTGQVANSGSATFATPVAVASNGFSGTVANGLTIAAGTTAGNTVTYTITNGGPDSATDFYINALPAVPSGWSAIASTCPTTSSTTLAVNGTCTVTATVATTNAGTTVSFTLNIGLNWKDQGSPSGTTQTLNLVLPQVTVVPIYGTISVTESVTEIGIGQSDMLTYTLNGSSGVDTFTVTAISNNTYALDANTNTCELSSANPSCQIEEIAGMDANDGPTTVSSSATAGSHTYQIPDTNPIYVGYAVKCTNNAVGSYVTVNGGPYLVVSNQTINDNKYNIVNGLKVCTSQVTNMSYLFYDKDTMNQDIANWDTSKVTDMSHMFDGATAFNQYIGYWDTESVTDMAYMFAWAKAFSQDISSWKTSHVTNMAWMFHYASSLATDLGGWDVSSVTNMDQMFSVAKIPGVLSEWNVKNVTNCYIFSDDPTASTNIRPKRSNIGSDARSSGTCYDYSAASGMGFQSD